MAAEKKTEEGQLPDLEAPKSQIVSRDEVSIKLLWAEKYGCGMFVPNCGWDLHSCICL